MSFLNWRKKPTPRAHNVKASQETSKRHPCGLAAVHNPESPVVDIVAIHGLDGHRENTWTASNGTNWLQQLLPKSIPNARILCWGYDSRTHAKDSISRDFLFSHAENLLGALSDDRQRGECEDRPIIFIAHSLGGILLIKALVMGSTSRPDHLPGYLRVKEATHAVLFMGTPLQGSEGANFGHTVLNVAKLVYNTNSNLVDKLLPNSEELQDLGWQFTSIHVDFRIRFFRESLDTPVGPLRKMIVPAHSAVIPGMRNAQVRGLQANHLDLVRYPSEEDQNYKAVALALELEVRAVEEAQSTTAPDIPLASAPSELARVSPYQMGFSLAGVPASARFIDRPSDMESLENCLLPDGSQGDRRKVFVLHGLGGVGKTQLAANFARRHQTAFSSVFWLDGRSETQLKQSFARHLGKIRGEKDPLCDKKPIASTPEQLDDAVADMTKWLGQPDNFDWLLIFDNVDHDYQAGGSGSAISAVHAYDVRKYLPWDHGAVLVTTRVSRLQQLAAPGHSRHLGKVDDSLARDIFEAWYGGQLGPDTNELLCLLDGLPLALAQAASYLQDTRISISDYVDLYRNQWDILMGSDSDLPLLEYEQGSIATTWTVSFQQIKTRNESAANILRLWAFLDNKGFFHGLLEGGSRRGHYPWPEWLRELATNEARFLEAIRLLLRYSMIEAQDGTTGSYSMHPVVHKWASHIDSLSIMAGHAHLAIALVASSMPERQDTKSFYSVLDQRLLPHAQRCAEWARNASFESLKTDNEDTLDFFDFVGTLFGIQGWLAEAESLFQRVLAGRERMLGLDHAKTLGVICDLGHIYLDRGKLADAEILLQRAVVISEQILGPDNPATWRAVHTLGTIYKYRDKPDMAERSFGLAAAGFRRVLGPGDLETLISINALGYVRRRQGRQEEAEKLLQHVLAGFANILPRRSARPLAVRRRVSRRVVSVNGGKPAKVGEMLRGALDYYERTLGPDDPSTLHTVVNIGLFCRSQGELAEAEALFQRAVAGHEKVFGPDHPDTLLATRFLKEVHADQEARTQPTDKKQEETVDTVPASSSED